MSGREADIVCRCSYSTRPMHPIWCRGSAADAEQRIEPARGIEGEKLVASADVPTVDEYLWDGVPSAGAFHHFHAPPGSQADIEFPELDPLAPQQPLGGEAVAAQKARINLDIRHFSIAAFRTTK